MEKVACALLGKMINECLVVRQLAHKEFSDNVEQGKTNITKAL